MRFVGPFSTGCQKLVDVVGLNLDAPEHALVLSRDEKSQILALDRTQKSLPLYPGRPDEVLDEQLREVPRCLLSHLPLIHKREAAGGFVIYAPGDNGMDEGRGERPDRQEGVGVSSAL